jgi:hypothetical protein
MKLLRPAACVASLAVVISIVVGCRGPASSQSTSAPTTAEVRFERSAPINDATIATQARIDIDWLASPERQGRGPGTEGLRQAGDYIAARFASLGLKPATTQTAGYFQDFTSGTTTHVDDATAIKFGDATLSRGTDYAGQAWSEPAKFDGPLAFVGYAVKGDAPATKPTTTQPATTQSTTQAAAPKPYDDFDGVDVKGKVVLAMRWEPHTADGKSRLSDDGEFTGDAALVRKAQRAADAGAIALLLVNPPAHHEEAKGLLSEDERGRQTASIPVFHLTHEAADRLLQAAGAHPLAELQKKIDESGEPASAVYSLNVTGELAVKRKPLKARNVVAIWPGRGKHADEYVVVGAHYDHLGMGGNGSLARITAIHPGADDNGSGTTALLALAAQVTKAGPLDRTVVFVAFTLEEQGLIGSKKFVDKLPVPKEKIVAMLNFDMVGRVRNEMLYTGGTGTHGWFAPIVAAADERSPLKLLSMGKGGRGPSDHQSFSAEGIPVVFFFSGIHSDYHRPTDTPDKINVDGIAQVVRLGFDVLNEACQMPQLAYVDTFDPSGVNVNIESGSTTVPAAPTRRGGGGGGRRKQLGIEPDMVDDGTTKGVRVSGTVPGTAARDAGILAGDVITQIDDKQMTDLQALFTFLSSKKPGDVIKVTLTRNGSPMTLDVKLKARGEER